MEIPEILVRFIIAEKPGPVRIYGPKNIVRIALWSINFSNKGKIRTLGGAQRATQCDPFMPPQLLAKMSDSAKTGLNLAQVVLFRLLSNQKTTCPVSSLPGRDIEQGSHFKRPRVS